MVQSDYANNYLSGLRTKTLRDKAKNPHNGVLFSAWFTPPVWRSFDTPVCLQAGSRIGLIQRYDH